MPANAPALRPLDPDDLDCGVDGGGATAVDVRSALLLGAPREQSNELDQSNGKAAQGQRKKK